MYKDIIFVCDRFIEQCKDGGAVFSLEALIDVCPRSYIKIMSEKITLDILNKYKDNFWVFSNTTIIGNDILEAIPKFLNNYVFIESDYKFCGHRSPALHKIQAKGNPCDCFGSEFSERHMKFIRKSRIIFWKSIKQRELYYKIFPELVSKESEIISATFTDEQIDKLLELRNSNIEQSSLYLILDNYLKGKDVAIEYCRGRRLNYDLIATVSRDQLLERIRGSRGIIFMPLCEDTCPRVVTEAKLLGVEYIINDNVQQKGEWWFETSNLESTVQYLRSRRRMFWDKCGKLIIEAEKIC